VNARPARGRRWRVWVARVVALLALGGAAAAIAVAVNSVKATDSVTEQDARDAMAQLATANQTLSDELNALAPGASPRLAQETVRTTAALSRRLDGEASGGGDLGDSVHAVLLAELAYLDAIGSTLNNPGSPLRGEIAQRGNTLREALQNIPGGAPRAVSGGAELIVFSKARVEQP
jgi:hypothetical protein